MTRNTTIETSDWLATRQDLYELKEEHKANVVGLSGMSLGATILFAYAQGAAGFLLSLLAASVVATAVLLINQTITARVVDKHAPLAEVVSNEIVQDLTTVELSTLIATDRVTVGKTLVKAEVSDCCVTVTEREYRFHDDTEHVSASRACAEMQSSYVKTFV